MTKSNLELYFCRDSRALRPLWALEELGLDYKLVTMDFPPRVKFEGYREINSLGTVPTLIDGSLTMTESAAMCQYLVDRHAPQSSLSVKPTEQSYGEYLDWLFRSDATFTFPQAIFLRYEIYESPERLQPQVAQDYIQWLFARLRIVESALVGNQYLCANRFTMADICVGYALYLAMLLGFKKQMGDNTQAYLDRICQRDGFKRCLEKQAQLEPIFPVQSI